MSIRIKSSIGKSNKVFFVFLRVLVQSNINKIRKHGKICNSKRRTVSSIQPGCRNGEIILTSEGYASKPSCMNGVKSVMKNAAEVKSSIEGGKEWQNFILISRLPTAR